MKRFLSIFAAFLLILSSEIPAVSMTLHDFMEDYVRAADKYRKKSGDPSILIQMIKVVPNLALPEQKERWGEIVNQALSDQKPEASCATCHKEFKKTYKKEFRKREVEIPEELSLLLKKI